MLLPFHLPWCNNRVIFSDNFKYNTMQYATPLSRKLIGMHVHFLYVFVARSWRYSSDIGIGKSRCKRLIFLLRYFLIIRMHLLFFIWTLGVLDLCVQAPGFTVKTDDWTNACYVWLEFHEWWEVAVEPDEGYSYEIVANILLSMLFICSPQRSFRSEVISRYISLLDKGNWMVCLKQEFIQNYIYVFSFCRTLHTYITSNLMESSLLMLCKENVPVYIDRYSNHLNTLCVQNGVSSF
jgi:hypothetical protein